MGKHLNFFYKCIQTGRLPENNIKDKDIAATGLCGAAEAGFISEKHLGVFNPTPEESKELRIENVSEGWWGSGLHTDHEDKKMGFTPLRQTIVLFMAALNKEFEK
jgi:hypothetical protein